jgi:hypothetical protein
LTSDGQDSSHALKDVTHILVHPLNRLLVAGFSFIDGGDDVRSVSSRKRNVCELFLQ